ncbi:T9SS type A sorting domain-containing protein [Flammeovirga sp. OC4]|uniref:T9SS type A sorting domain-containing protein n=1 Tax=Flammeovirga sp. OC4 TaxID=1382345 RepID=UPI0005C45CEA|nr:T9SS type A sorting domain-containing protein [Flammeovirga sp. OC4]
MKRSYFILLTVTIINLVTLLNTSLFAQTPTYSGGTGTQDDPFLISTPQDLLALSTTEAEVHWVEGTHFKLTTDIDMEGITGMKSIGYEYTDGDKVVSQFKGNFDGNHHVIRNLSITESRTTKTLIGHGLFGNTSNASVINLGLIDPYINVVAERVGAILGNAALTTMENCFIIGGSIEGQGKVGGIMGKPNNGTIVKNCFSSVELRARYIKNGAIFGDIDNITNLCYFENLVFYGQYGWSEEYNKQSTGDSGFNGNDGKPGEVIIVDPQYVKNIYTIVQTTPKYNTVTVRTPIELTTPAAYTGFDFTDGTGQWVMKQNSFAVLQGFESTVFDGLITFEQLPLQIIASDNTTPIEGATVTINEVEYTTNAQGMIDDLFEPGSYDFTVTKDGYKTNSGSLSTNDEEMTYVVFLTDSEESFDISLKFMKEGGTVLEGVAVTITDGQFFNNDYITNADGMISINGILAKEYSYTATKDLFLEKNSTFTVTQNETFDITLDKDNKAPVADAGLPRVVASGDLVTLDASLSSDANGDALTYLWEPVGNDIVLSPTSANVDRVRTFIAPDVTETTVYTFKVTVGDGTVESTAEVDITVKGGVFYGLELLANGSFEKELTEGWIGLDGVHSTSDEVDSEKTEGTKSLRFFSKEKQLGGYHNSATEIASFIEKPLIIGRTYLLRGRVKAVAMSMNVINLRVMPQTEWYDGAKIGLTRPTVTWGKELTLNEWIEFEKIITISPEFTSNDGDGLGDEVLAKLNIYPSPRLAADTDPEDEIYLDDLSIVEYDADIMQSAGQGSEVRAGSMVDLMGSYVSSEMLSTMWTSKEDLAITDADKMKASFTVPNVMEDTDYTFSFNVTKALRTDKVEVVYTAIPNAVADAGEAQTIEANQEVTLDATASLPANVTLKWTNEHQITLDDDAIAQPKFTAPLVTEKTDYTFTLTASYKGMEVTDQVVVTVLPITKAVAGDDQTAQSGELVTLDASASTPATATYAWTAPEGITLSDETAAMPTFTAPVVTQKTDYDFTLKVTYEGKEDTDMVTVSVYPVIVAAAGDDQSVIENTTVNLDGSQSTTENVTYAWTASDDNIVITNADMALASFTAPEVTTATDITFTLTVTYDENLSETDDVIVTVYPEIMAHAGDDQAAMSTETVTLDGSMSSTDVTYAWTSDNDNVIITDADMAMASFTAPVVTTATQITFTLTVSGQNNQEKSDDVVITVYPEITAAAGDDQTVLEGSTVTLDGSQSSANVTYAWTASDANIVITNADMASASFTAPEVDQTTDITFTLTITDEFNQMKSDEVTVTVYSTITAAAGDDQTVKEGTNVSLTGSNTGATDVSFLWTSNNDNVVITNADMASASFTAPAVDQTTDITFTLTVSDQFNQTVSDEVVVTVYPEITAAAGDDQTVMEGSTVTLDGSQSSANVTYAWTSSDANIVITNADMASASFTAPEVDETTEITFTLKASDTYGQEVMDEVKVTVYSTITAAAGDDQTVKGGTTVSLTGSNTGTTDASFLWTSNNDNVVITNADMAAATFTAPDVTEVTEILFTLTVSDLFNQTATDEIKVTVYPVITANAGDDQTVTEGDVVTLDGSLSTADNVTYAWTSSDETITITDADKASPSFTAPEVDEATEITLTLKVTDTFGQEVMDEVIVTVNPISDPTSVDPSLVNTVSAYPNPTSNNINIEVTQNATAYVMDTNGKMLQTVSLLKGKNTIDLSSYNFGIYMINIQSENTVEVVKVIKK